MFRFHHDEGPWNSHIASIGDTRHAPMLALHETDLRTRFHPSTAGISPYAYRDPPASEWDSSVTGRSAHDKAPSDSGYASKSQAARSEGSVDPVVSNQHYRSLGVSVNQMDLEQYSNRDLFFHDDHGHHAPSSINDGSTSNVTPSPTLCRDCKMPIKNQSELKYFLPRTLQAMTLMGI